MKILIADDHQLMRQGLRNLLLHMDKNMLVVEAVSYKDVNSQLQKNIDFDLLLIDLTMPGNDPLLELNNILNKSQSCPLVVISSSENPDEIQSILNLGAKGFIPKSEKNQVMLAAIKLVMEGGIYIPNQLLSYATSKKNQATHLKPDLTRRQKEVVRLLSQGISNKEIGNKLGLTEGTVRSHLVSIFKALSVSNRTQAGIKARQLGLVE